MSWDNNCELITTAAVCFNGSVAEVTAGIICLDDLSEFLKPDDMIEEKEHKKGTVRWRRWWIGGERSQMSDEWHWYEDDDDAGD